MNAQQIGAAGAVLITGVSSGLGFGLAKEYLQRGRAVLGMSRRRPEDLARHENFFFESVDLAQNEAIRPALGRLLGQVDSLDLAILNAGVLGNLADMAEQSLEEIQHVMQVNVWANKVLLDVLFPAAAPRQVVTISSGASVNGNRGWGGYSISKAALNMLTRLYARERPDTHFCALAPGLVDTAMQDEICGREADERFPSVESIKSKRHTEAMPTGEQLAPRLVEIIDRLPQLVDSGEFADIRQPPLAEFE